jgi:putative transposase
MQRELLDRTSWDSRTRLATAMFEWIEGFYNARRRHSSLGNLSPAEFEALHTAAEIAA